MSVIPQESSGVVLHVLREVVRAHLLADGRDDLLPQQAFHRRHRARDVLAQLLAMLEPKRQRHLGDGVELVQPLRGGNELGDLRAVCL